jgi:hypothetical protein
VTVFCFNGAKEVKLLLAGLPETANAYNARCLVCFENRNIFFFFEKGSYSKVVVRV